MGITQVVKLARMAKTFVRNHSTDVQFAAFVAVPVGMVGGGLLMMAKAGADATRRTLEEHELNVPRFDATIRTFEEHEHNVPRFDATRRTFEGRRNESSSNQPQGQVVLEEGTISEPGHRDYKKDYTKQFVKYGEQADTIGNVVFEKGLVTDVDLKADSGFELDFSPHGDTHIWVGLSDGSGIEFAPQYETNKARVSKQDDVLVFEGINRMYFSGTDSKLGKYKFFGCQGCVNTSNGKDGDEVISGHRRMPGGAVQKSSLFLVDKNVHESPEKDVYLVTENDAKF